jgi:hypothetical protein
MPPQAYAIIWRSLAGRSALRGFSCGERTRHLHCLSVLQLSSMGDKSKVTARHAVLELVLGIPPVCCSFCGEPSDKVFLHD